MKFSQITRIHEWWGFKLSPLILSYYYYCLISKVYFSLELIITLSVILVGLIIGASFVSIIGEYYDQETDAACGKDNYFSKLSTSKKKILLSSTVFITLGFTFSLYARPYACFFYFLASFSFYLYSSKIFRFKERPKLGFLFDALGSTLFPALFIYMMFNHLYSLNIYNCIPLLLWIFAVGLRGIISHMHVDSDNDRASGISNFVTALAYNRRVSYERFFILLEFFNLALMLFLVNSKAVYFFILIYVLLAVIRSQNFNQKIILFNAHKEKKFTLLMVEFYVYLLPIGFLIDLIWIDNKYVILLILHLLLFGIGTFGLVKELMFGLKHLPK